MIYLVAYQSFWRRLPAENRTLCGRVKRLEVRASHYGVLEYYDKAVAVGAAKKYNATVIRESNRGENWDYELLINFEKPNG